MTVLDRATGCQCVGVDLYTDDLLRRLPHDAQSGPWPTYAGAHQVRTRPWWLG